jgi:hypothetical protein
MKRRDRAPRKPGARWRGTAQAAPPTDQLAISPLFVTVMRLARQMFTPRSSAARPFDQTTRKS